MKKSVIFSAACLYLCACSNEVDFGEQYKKTVYIVNSADLLYTGDHFFGAENNEIVISVYCASSEPITAGITARLMSDARLLDSLNTIRKLSDSKYVDKLLLPESNYRMDNQVVTIKAGEQYGTLHIPFSPVGLNVDQAYTLPLYLISNSAGYDVNPLLRSIVYEINMVNEYSGNFSGSSQESPTAIRGVQPVLKAMSINTVRMPIHNLDDDALYLANNFMLLTIVENGAVHIAPWQNANVTDMGGSVYDPLLQSFELHYQFTNTNSDTFEIVEIISNINAIDN
jgi:hypothetical protein